MNTYDITASNSAGLPVAGCTKIAADYVKSIVAGYTNAGYLVKVTENIRANQVNN